MRCASCGAASEIGALCLACASKVTPCDGLLPEHMSSKVEPSAAKAWLVDGFGGLYAIGMKATIGRNLKCEVVVLASSVSRDHAELARGESAWMVRDLGSRNGTFVDGVRIDGEVALSPQTLLKVGDVALWFLAKPLADPPPRPEVATAGVDPVRRSQLAMGPTVNGRRSALVRYQFEYRGRELCIVAGDDATAGGALLWRMANTESWSERRLARLEFQLLRALCIRAHVEAASPSSIRGCMSSKQLLRELLFQSKFANQENVRQVVLRVRTALADVGADGVLAIAPGRGYYLDTTVTAADVDPP
jgi:hypothetical protein